MAGQQNDHPDAEFTRTIKLTASHGRVVAVLKDCFHEMRVVLTHAHGLVTSASGRMDRHPWTTCPGALAGLSQLAGTALSDMRAALLGITRRSYCTHLGDLASLAAAQAARGGTRKYHVLVWVSGNPQTAVWRNGSRQGVLDPEAVFVARRAEHVALGLTLGWDSVKTASDLGLAPSCHSLQPDIAMIARPVGPDGVMLVRNNEAPSTEQ